MTNITSRQQCMCVFNTIEMFRQFIIPAKYVKQVDNYNCCNIFFLLKGTLKIPQVIFSEVLQDILQN